MQWGKGLSLGVAAAIIWGGFPVISRLGLQESLNAFDITAIRYAVAGLLLFPVLLRRRFSGVPPLAVLIITCGMGAPYLMLAAGGLSFAPASHFGIIAPSSMLIFTAIGSRLWQGDRFNAGRIFGMLVIIAGILFIGYEGLNAPGRLTFVGDLMFVAAGLFWSGYTLATRAWGLEPFHGVAIVAVVSFVLYLPGYFLFGSPNVFTASLDEVLLQGIFQGVLSAIVALWFYTRAVKILGAARGAVFAALVPGFALLLAIPVLGEIPTGLQIAGVALVSTGMIFALGLIGGRKVETLRKDEEESPT